MVRDGWLGETYAFFNVAGAEAVFSRDENACGRWSPLFEGREDAAARGIGDGMERVVERDG